ncbi:MAG: ferredoxin [Candidatus Verstraetearchaeota archaeon]|nr:ferredoxin [Candidatus Verstraetearchaeota archaeon]
MAKVPRVDRDLCIGCGNCTVVCPEVFELDHEGKSQVVNEMGKCDLEYAVSSCPVGAISLL